MPRKTTNAVHRHFEWDENSKYSSCKLCGNKLKGNHATNLLNHTRLKHENIYKEIVEINKVSCVNIKDKSKEKEDEKENKRRKLLDCCIKLIAVHGRPFEYLEDKSFRDINALIYPDFAHESNSKKVKECITEKAYEIKEKIAAKLKNKMISIKLDSATCMERQFIGVNIQYIDKSKIVLRNLAIQEIFIRQTAENLKSIILEILGDYQINLRNIYSITTDNGSNYLKVTTLFNEEIRNNNQNAIENNHSEDETDEDEPNNENISSLSFLEAADLNDVEDVTEADPFLIPSLRCAAHTLQLCIKDAISKDPRTEWVIENCRSVVRILRRPLMKIKIKSLKLRKPIIDCSTRWASTYNMLNRLKGLKPICNDSEDILEIVGENFWIEMDNILQCLHPAAEATIRIQAEQLTLGDFYSIWIICKTKTEKVNLPLAKDIVNAIMNREADLLANKAFLAAIFVDPRWKIILSDQEKDTAKNWLKDVHQQISRITQSHEESIIGQENQEGPSTSPLISGCSRVINEPNLNSADNYYTDLQSLESILNETQLLRGSVSVRLNFEYFLAEYATVPRLSITENIIKYWSDKLPNKLAEVALIVLAAPATQVTVERLFSTLKFVLSPSRNRLMDHTIKNIILIKCNEDLFED